MTSSLEQNALIGTGSSPETSLVEIDDVIDSVHPDAERILREVEERQNKRRDAHVIFFKEFLGTRVEDHDELCERITRQMSQELESMRPDTLLTEDQFAAFLSLLLDSFDPTETSLHAFLVLNIQAFVEERTRQQRKEGDANPEIASMLQKAFDVYQNRGFERAAHDQIALTTWLGEEKRVGIGTYADALWILAQEFLDHAVTRINEYCGTYPQIRGSDFLYRGLYAIFRSIDLYIPNSAKTMEDFVKTGIDIALERTAGN